MGNNSSQQAQPMFHPQSEPIVAQNQPAQSSDITHTSNNIHHSSSNNNNKNETNGAIKVAIKLPHNYEAIIKDPDFPVDKSSPTKLLQQLRDGVFLNGKSMKYWVTENNINCFLVFAKSLKIVWAEDMRYWVFQNIETSEGNTTVAVLRNVCWLEVNGRLHTMNLTPGVKYEVAYLIKLEDSSYGWTVPVNFRLTLPNGTKREHKERLNQIPREEWIRIPIQEFEAPAENHGEIEFSLYEYEGGSWKKGLVIKGVTIEPKI